MSTYSPFTLFSLCCRFPKTPDINCTILLIPAINKKKLPSKIFLTLHALSREPLEPTAQLSEEFPSLLPKQISETHLVPFPLLVRRSFRLVLMLLSEILLRTRPSLVYLLKFSHLLLTLSLTKVWLSDLSLRLRWRSLHLEFRIMGRLCAEITGWRRRLWNLLMDGPNTATSTTFSVPWGRARAQGLLVSIADDNRSC